MKKNCIKCGEEFETQESWKTMCTNCYLTNKKNNTPTQTNNKKDQTIKRLAILKTAATQSTNRTPEQLIIYAKQLETLFDKW